MDQYFKVNLNRMSARELWRHAPGPVTALLVIALKTLRIVKLQDRTLHRFAPFGALLTPESALSQTARERLAPPIEGFTQLGFRSAAFQKLENPYDPKILDSGGVFFLHSSNEYMALAAYFRRSEPGGIMERVALGVFSDMQSGRRVGVTNLKAYLDPVGKNQVSYLKTNDPKRLLAAHEKQVVRLRSNDVPLKIADIRDLEKQHDYYQNLEIDARTRRGLFEPPTPQELLEAQQDPQSLMSNGPAA